ncbi:hypothetical protein SeLEV6574_g03965 [Synchytrium endobioticum]|uniref:Uncharacterized protein n=1 Tax=Synchytrium endobioticum TaxID=286115 RepID=A0A507D1B7_9FUNG|nr:hypothetical protein SeLEV6574_g03965 [Synchytrium endobioticum]
MKCPVPPILKVSPKVVEFDHDKYEEPKKAPEVKAVKPSSKAKAKRAPSGRSSRRTTVEKNDSDEETSKKNFTDATRALEDDPPSPPPPVQVFYKINRSFQKTVREVAGVGPKTSKWATRTAFMKNPSKGRLLEEVFLLPPEMLAKSRYVLDDSPRRYVRTSSFKTNGLVLSLLWIDTTGKPPLPDRKLEDAINLPNIFKNKLLRFSALELDCIKDNLSGRG